MGAPGLGGHWCVLGGVVHIVSPFLASREGGWVPTGTHVVVVVCCKVVALGLYGTKGLYCLGVHVFKCGLSYGYRYETV